MLDQEFTIVTADGDEYRMSEGRIKELTSKFIERCGQDAALNDDFGMNVKVVDLLINIKKAWWPATQRALTANIDDFDKQLEKWYTLQRDVLEQKKKQEKEVELVVSETLH